MLRTYSRIVALAAMVAALSMTAQAADETLTLACEGTATNLVPNAKPISVSMAIIVDFADRTVKGFSTTPADEVKVDSVNEMTVAFSGSGLFGGWTINGRIDRVTGALEATTRMSDHTRRIVGGTNYSLKCRPAQRMF